MSTVVVVVVGKKVVSRVSVLSDEATPRDAIGAKQSLSSNHMSTACLAKPCLPKLDMQTFSKESNASDCLSRFVCTGVPGTLAFRVNAHFQCFQCAQTLSKLCLSRFSCVAPVFVRSLCVVG